MAEKYNASERRMKLRELLRGRRHPVSIKWLADHFGKSYDTINRDLDALERTGFPTDRFTDPENGSRVVMPRSHERLDAAFSMHEVKILSSLEPMVAPYHGTLVHHGYESARAKITDTLSEKDRAHVLGARNCFHFVPDGGVLPYADSDKRDIFDSVYVAADRNRRLKYTYQSTAGARHTGILEPFVLIPYRSTLYVIGHATPSADYPGTLPPVVRWPVHRFIAVELTRESFEVPADFQVEDHFNGWGIVAGQRREHIVVEFSARIAPLIAERQWNPTQRLDWLPGGRLQFSCDVALTPELTSWVLGYGCDARVIAPSTLRDELLYHHTHAIATMLEHGPPSVPGLDPSNENGAPQARLGERHESATASADVDDDDNDDPTTADASSQRRHG